MEFGRPLRLEASGGWLLQRTVPGTGQSDAMGAYPLFACRHWRSVAADLEKLESSLVSVALVTDPFGDWDEAVLRESFDRVREFKAHFVADLAAPSERIVSKHHRYYARRALAEVTVDVSADPRGALDEWLRLYAQLVTRHGISGMRAFSRASFAAQLGLPGMVLFTARRLGKAVGAHLWLMSGLGETAVAYSHLAAFDTAGYELGAAYALHSTAIEYFRGRAAWLDLGAGAGLGSSVGADDGLTWFKAGWSTGTRPAYLCGRVLSRRLYEELTKERGSAGDSYFPAYRAGEFGGRAAAS